MFGIKPQTGIRRFEFSSQTNKMQPDQRSANALEHIAYSLGRIEMHLDILAQAQSAKINPTESPGDE